MKKIVEAKAPFRLGLAGGGTDVSPYCNQFGGLVVNATISLYAQVRLESMEQNGFTFFNQNEDLIHTASADTLSDVPKRVELAAGVLRHFLQQGHRFTAGLKISTWLEVPIGSGLGTSSTLVVALIKAFNYWLQVELDPLEMAALAYDIERNQMGFAGGHQDQYAAALGGFNRMEFGPAERVHIQPLQLPEKTIQALQQNLVLYYTGQSRLSSAIIEEQQAHVRNGDAANVNAMHFLKQQALYVSELLTTGNLDALGAFFDEGFSAKKQMAAGITNKAIEQVYATAKEAGATGGKISGAGGGGFLFFFCPNGTKPAVQQALLTLGGKIFPFHFAK